MGANLRGVSPKTAVLLVLLAAGCASPQEQAAFDLLRLVGSDSGYDGAKRELPTLGEGATLNDYLRYAALNNPGLEAAFNRWKAALERVPQVRSLPDPKFTYRYYIREVETRVGPQQHAVALSQKFPWFGKLHLRGSVALEAAHAARQRYEAAKQRLFFRVKNAYYEYSYLGRAIAIVRENRDLVKHFERVVRARYKAAAARHQDTIRAQVELGKLEDRLRTLTALRGPLAARLNAALGRPVTAPIPWPGRPPFEEIAATDDQVLRWLRRTSPELKALEHEIAKGRRALELARKSYYPDVVLGVNYIQTGRALLPTPDNSKDPIIASISLNLPLWVRKYRSAEREARARLEAARKAKREREHTLSSETKMVLYQFRDAGRKVDLYHHTLLPKARQALLAIQTSFRTGKAGFLDLIDAERTLLEFQLSYERALTDRAQHLAELEALVGKRIPRKGERRPAPPAKKGDGK